MSRNSLKRKTLATAMGITLLAGSATAFAGGDRLECRASMAGEDASMDARFEADGGRMKFSASFEAAPGGSFMAGDPLGVRVGSELVAYMVLAGAAPAMSRATSISTLPPRRMTRTHRSRITFPPPMPASTSWSAPWSAPCKTAKRCGGPHGGRLRAPAVVCARRFPWASPAHWPHSGTTVTARRASSRSIMAS